MSKYVHENVTILIIGDHPHAGELCHPIGSTPNTVTPWKLFGGISYKVKLVNCPHKIDECFVAKSAMKLIGVEEVNENKSRRG